MEIKNNAAQSVVCTLCISQTCTHLLFTPQNGLECKIYGATNYTVSAYVFAVCISIVILAHLLFSISLSPSLSHSFYLINTATTAADKYEIIEFQKAMRKNGKQDRLEDFMSAKL